MKKIITSGLLLFTLFSQEWAHGQIMFTEYSIDENFSGVSTRCLVDIDNDGTKEIADQSLDGVHEVINYDADNDGDVVATGKFPTSKLSLWNNQGGTPNIFAETIINDQLSAFWALCVDDFDNYGDLDFISGASVSGVIRW